MTTSFPYTSVEQIFQGQPTMASNPAQPAPTTVLEHMRQDAVFTQLDRLDSTITAEDPNDPLVQFKKLKESFKVVIENVVGQLVTPEILKVCLANEEKLGYTIARNEWGRNLALMAYKCTFGGALKSQSWINDVLNVVNSTPVSAQDEEQSTLARAIQSL